MLHYLYARKLYTPNDMNLKYNLKFIWHNCVRLPIVNFETRYTREHCQMDAYGFVVLQTK